MYPTAAIIPLTSWREKERHFRKRISRPSADCPSLHAEGVLGFSFWNEHRKDGHWSLWPRLDMERTRVLLKLPRTHLRMAVSVITGHCTFGNHARRLGLPYNGFCRSCHSEEENETVLHLQRGILNDLSELSTV
ncbi:hypothetical protein EVAR_74007_1, partial [Eumeta japonica]